MCVHRSLTSASMRLNSRKSGAELPLWDRPKLCWLRRMIEPTGSFKGWSLRLTTVSHMFQRTEEGGPLGTVASVMTQRCGTVASVMTSFIHFQGWGRLEFPPWKRLVKVFVIYFVIWTCALQIWGHVHKYLTKMLPTLTIMSSCFSIHSESGGW